MMQKRSITLYVTDEEDHLLGVFSLRQLVLANPKNHIKDFMENHRDHR